MAIAALVLGTLSIILPYIGILPGILALIFGIIAIRRKKRKQIGIAGTVTASIGLSVQISIIVISISAFITFSKRSKTAEAMYTVQNIARYLSLQRETRGAFPKGTQWTPPNPCCKAACADPGRPALFSVEPWASVGLSESKKMNYQYRWIVQGDTAVVEAKGDLDCDGEESLFRQTVKGTAGSAAIEEITKVRELE